MYEEINIEFPNGVQVIVWRTGDDVCIGVLNEKGYVVTDRKLSVSEVDKLNSITQYP